MLGISIIINTYKRPDKTFECIKSILKSNFKNFEIIIVDQLGDGELKEKLKVLKKEKIYYFNLKSRGGSRAKNFGVKKVKGSIIVFTDDDCIIDKNWLKQIYKSFQNHKYIAAVFGRVLPYQPQKHQSLVCPCTFVKEKQRIISQPCRHWREIGFGNNMAFRKEIFNKMGDFKEWLGPGNLGLAAEDAEFCYRLLLKGYKILYNPKALIYHNRWLKKESDEWKRQIRSYACGGLAAYGFYAFQGKKLAKEVVREHLKVTFWHVYSQTKKAIKTFSLIPLGDAIMDIYYNLRGLLVAFWFAKF